MGKVVTVLYWLLLMVGAVTAQADKVQQSLPNWLTGIIAVAVFLFLVFVAFLVNKAWCEEPRKEEKVEVEVSEYTMSNGSTYSLNLDPVRTAEHLEAYENVIIHKSEEKVTVM